MALRHLKPLKNSQWDEQKARHLLNRAGFGIPHSRVENLASMKLEDAALEDSVNVVADLWPGAPMTLVLEDAFEAELDSIVKVLPAFPGPDTQSYNLVVRIDRGALSGEGEGLLPNRVAVSWEVAGGDAADPIDVGLLLVSPNPIATETGTRRGPIVSAGAMAVGLFVLIAGVISIDTWTQAYREDARHVRPVDEPARGHEPGKDEPEEYEAEEETGDEDAEPGPWQWQRPKAPSGSADAY